MMGQTQTLASAPFESRVVLSEEGRQAGRMVSLNLAGYLINPHTSCSQHIVSPLLELVSAFSHDSLHVFVV